MNERRYPVITVAPGEATFLKLEGGEWICISGVSQTVDTELPSQQEAEEQDPAVQDPTFIAPSASEQDDSYASQQVPVIPILKPPTVPVWGTVLIRSPGEEPNDGLDRLDLASVSVRFEPNPGSFEAATVYVSHPRLATAIEMSEIVEIGDDKGSH